MTDDWKGIFRLLDKATVVVLACALIWGVVAYGLSKYPLRFFDGEIGWYLQNKDFTNSSGVDYRVIISGDSAAKCDWMPAILSDDTYNIALGGASVVENYYYFVEYLEHHSAPKYFIYSQNPGHFFRAGTFWSRSVYFHRMNKDNIDEILGVAERCNDSGGVYYKNARRDEVLYSIYFPQKYLRTFVKGLLSQGRYNSNIEVYRNATRDRGQAYFGKAKYTDEIEKYVKYSEFIPADITDVYLKKIMKLCRDRDIIFVYQSVPINEQSYKLLSNSFLATYKKYMLNLQRDNPSAIIDTELMHYDKYKFGDRTHLNCNGTRDFSKEMRNKYHYIFQ